MHPLLEEICRIPGLGACQATSFNRFQRLLRTDIQPMLDERDKLIEENAALREELTKAQKSKKQAVTA